MRRQQRRKGSITAARLDDGPWYWQQGGAAWRWWPGTCSLMIQVDVETDRWETVAHPDDVHDALIWAQGYTYGAAHARITYRITGEGYTP